MICWGWVFEFTLTENDVAGLTRILNRWVKKIVGYVVFNVSFLLEKKSCFMKIRPIAIADNASVAALIRGVLEEHNVPKVGTAYADPQLDYMFEAYEQSRSVYYVVEEEGRIIGGAGISPLENSDVNICELQKMYFLEVARGRGIGEQMIRLCLQKAKEFGFDSCYLETMTDMLAAQKLYKKIGFEYLCNPLGNTGHSSCPVWMLLDLNKFA